MGRRTNITRSLEAVDDRIERLISSKKVIVCAGSGGVGKTTMSAAIAIKAALLGRQAIVITIDPAKRLATSLGMESLGSAASNLTPVINRDLHKRGEGPCEGSFFAVMPDTTRVFEDFIRSMASHNQSVARRILGTSIYKIFAKEFSGANEYMATAKLYELYKENAYDLIVLDTPPSANTKMFLEAPRLLAQFFDDRIIKWFVAPGARFVAAGMRKLMEILEKLTGHGFISELLEFTSALFELRTQFRENLSRIDSLLHQSDVSFLMVTSPERLSKNDTQDFVAMLASRGYALWGFVVNRTLSERLGVSLEPQRPLNEQVEGWAKELEADATKAEIASLKAAFGAVIPALQHERDAAAFLSRFTSRQDNVVFVPEQPTDVHSVTALVDLEKRLR